MKAGLCENVDEYEFSSYSEFITGQNLVDTGDIFALISKESFIEINRKPVLINCLDMTNKPSASPSDEHVRAELLKVSGCESISEFQALEARMRNECIKKLKDKGFTIRQLSRLTGIGYNIIRRV